MTPAANSSAALHSTNVIAGPDLNLWIIKGKRMATKKRVVRKHEVFAQLTNVELVKAKSSLNL